jgi:D-lactate dehydrogenase (cytochrome)
MNTEPGSVDAFLEDAAHYPGGHASGIVFPGSVQELAEILPQVASALPVGAQSSLTGGATPMGETIVSTSKLTRIVCRAPDLITVESGVTVAAMQEELAASGAWFPPAPTFTGASAGGIVATNAAGAATFKYGSTREWVEGIVVVLADGTVLDLKRGECRAHAGRLQLQTRRGPVVVPVPSYVMPEVAKRSAGYHAAPEMDLVDLFVGSEGTLGVVAQVTFRVVAPAPQSALALIPCRSEGLALDVVLTLARASVETRRSGDPAGIDAAAIENMDARSVAILREDAADAANDVSFPADTAVALLVQLELPPAMTSADAYDQIGGALTPGAPDTPLTRFCRLLEKWGLLDVTEMALPGDRRRVEQLVAIRESVPAGVNRRVGVAKRDIDPRIEKTAADIVVPVERFGEMMAIYRRGFESRGLDYAIWGHISDGNVHPNVIPHSYDDVLRGKEAILEFGRAAVGLAGCPLAEHGVGRNAVKQALLRQLYGDDGIEAMRAVKRALDPDWKLAPGVIFTRG